MNRSESKRGIPLATSPRSREKSPQRKLPFHRQSSLHGVFDHSQQPSSLQNKKNFDKSPLRRLSSLNITRPNDHISKRNLFEHYRVMPVLQREKFYGQHHEKGALDGATFLLTSKKVLSSRDLHTEKEYPTVQAAPRLSGKYNKQASMNISLSYIDGWMKCTSTPAVKPVDESIRGLGRGLEIVLESHEPNV